MQPNIALLVILGGLMFLSLILPMSMGVFHLDKERDRARRRRWWDRRN